MPQTFTGCPFCSLTDVASVIGHHLDSFVREAAAAKRMPYRHCSLHPELLVRALRSESRRGILIHWTHPSPEVRTVAQIYAARLMRDTPAELVASAIHRTELGDISAAWWITRVLAAADKFESGRIDKRGVRDLADDDVTEAKKILRDGNRPRPVSRAPRTPDRQVPAATYTVLTPLHVNAGNRGCAIRDVEYDVNAANTGCAITDAEDAVNAGNRNRDCGNRTSARDVGRDMYRPAEASRQGARREAMERDESEDSSDDDDAPKSPSVRNFKRLIEKTKLLEQANKKLLTQIKGKGKVATGTAGAAAAQPEVTNSRKHASTPTPATPSRGTNRSKIPRWKSPLQRKAPGNTHSTTGRAIETIVISSDDAPVDPPSSPPVFHPLMTLRVENLNLTPALIEVQGDMSLADLLDAIWAHAPASAIHVRRFMGLYSVDRRFPGPWDERMWQLVVAAAGAEVQPPMWVASIGYVR